MLSDLAVGSNEDDPVQAAEVVAQIAPEVAGDGLGDADEQQ